MKKYIIDEDVLFDLLENEMWMDCLNRDGVDNWIGYGISYHEVIDAYTPKGCSVPEDASFGDVILTRLASGEFEEYEEE